MSALEAWVSIRAFIVIAIMMATVIAVTTVITGLLRAEAFTEMKIDGICATVTEPSRSRRIILGPALGGPFLLFSFCH